MGHRVLYIEKSNYLQLYLDNLKIANEQGDLLFPLSDIQILVIDNYRSVLSVPLINKLSQYNICVIVCGIDHLPTTYIMTMNGHFSQSGNIQNQINWNEKTKGVLQKLIVKAKIFNQIEILKKQNKSFQVIQKMFQYYDEVIPYDRKNREGLSAKLYFKELYGKDFIRFNDDIINAGLNYGYSIFRSLIASIVVAKGYLPNLGLFHKGKQNMFNLCDDLIEVFRPIVDDYVYENLMEEVIFKAQFREELIQLTLKKVEIDGKYQTIANAIYQYLESIIKVLETQDEHYYVFPSVLYKDGI